MPRKAHPWFRFYVEAVHDRKLRRMDPAVRWTWVAVLAIVRRSPNAPYMLVGEGQAVDATDLADVAAVPLRTAKKALQEFVDAGIVSWDSELKAYWVTRWSDRQFESDDVTARVRKHRDSGDSEDVETTLKRSNVVTRNVPNPPLERFASVTDTETDTEAEENPPTPRKRGDESLEHHGQHGNCRKCGTNQRGAKEPDPTTRHLRAIESERERNAARLRGEACESCEGSGWVEYEDEDGFSGVTQCAQCVTDPTIDRVRQAMNAER